MLSIWIVPILFIFVCTRSSATEFERGDPPIQDRLCNATSLASGLRLNENTEYVLQDLERCSIENAENLSIRGGPNTTIFCNITSTLFTFINVTSLTIQDVHFTGCGGVLTGYDLSRNGSYSTNETYFYFSPGQRSVLFCNHCSKLTLTNVSFSNNAGYAFIGINLRNDSVLDGVEVIGKINPKFVQPELESRGVLLLFVDTDNFLSNSTVLVNNSMFNLGSSSECGNFTCVKSIYEEFIDAFEVHIFKQPLPEVGALSILYMQQNYTVNVDVVRTNFTDNHGVCMGAVFIFLFPASSELATQTFQDCNFTKNYPHLVTSEEGRNYFGEDITVFMRFGENYGESKSVRSDEENRCVLIMDSSFENSYSYFNDSFVNSNVSLSTPSISVSHFHDAKSPCTLYLQDISVNGSTKFLYVSGIDRDDTLNVEIKDLKLRGGSLKNHYNLKSLDQYNGLLMFLNVHKVLINGTGRNTCWFENLLGPVISLISTEMFLTGEIFFGNLYSSQWANGAAVLLLGGSTLWFQEPLEAMFFNNSAISGGAIASDKNIDEFCLFQYRTDNFYTESNISLINISVTFKSNRAILAGNSIFIDKLYLCSVQLSPKIHVSDIQLVYNVTFKFVETVENDLQEMSSYPERICYCNGDLNDTRLSSLSCSKDALQVTTYPGKHFTVKVVSVDEISNPVYTFMYNDLLPKDTNSKYFMTDFNWRLGYGQDILKVYGYNCSQFKFSIFTNVLEHSEGQLRMYPYERVQSLTIPIVIKDCPLGFTLQDEGYCDCCELLTNKSYRCDIDTGIITKPRYGSWMGVVDYSTRTIGYSSYCPSKYCNLDISINSDDFNAACRFNRIGILCSQCPPELSSVMGHPLCQKCSNYWLLTVPMLGLAGIIMVILLLLLRLTVATGTFNGVIFFANLFNINTYFFMGHSPTTWLRVFISLLNLELGFPLCLYDGMRPVIASYLSFLVPVYLWFIVFVIIVLSRYFQIVSKLTSRSAIPVLATIIHLSFSKLLRLVVDGLSFIKLDMEDENRTSSSKLIWYFDGNVDYIKGKHIGLFLLSVISLVFFLIPYTIFLTGIKQFSRYSFANRIRPFIDAFCAPFKDRWRFWFGVRLWVLVVLYIVYTLMRNSTDVFIFIQTLVLLLFTLAQVAIMPYKNRIINFLDAFFLVDALLVNIAALYDSYAPHVNIVSLVLITPVFIVSLLIIVYHVCVVLGVKFRIPFQKKSRNRDDAISDRVEESDPVKMSEKSSNKVTYSSVIVNNLHSVYRYKPGQLRESLLESDSLESDSDD